MKLKFYLRLVVFMIFSAVNAETPIAIPPIITGDNINLEVKESTTVFYPGFNTTTLGYNGAFLGPTILLNKGKNVTINLKNSLVEGTTIHWHGMHVSPKSDGGPHSPISAGTTWSPSFTVMDKAATYWYHPHAMGTTMNQVLKCASGMIIVKDDEEAALSLPRTYGVDDFPLVCQWKTFNDVSKQIDLMDELDNVVMVNATLNGSLDVPAQLVRLRVLNGSTLRYFRFAFSDNRPFKQITSDEGLLDAPVEMTAIEMAPGERAEIIVDFSGQNGSSVYLKQLGSLLGLGYPGGASTSPKGILDGTDFNILKVNVVAPTLNPITTIPSVLTKNVITSSVGASTKNIVINKLAYDSARTDFTAHLNDVMIWNVSTTSTTAHPLHIHGNYFYILKINGVDPPLNMRGRKDVVTIPPKVVGAPNTVQLITKYEDFADDMMPYMYHCHILGHEEAGMMGQFLVLPNTNAVSDVFQENNIKLIPGTSNNDWTVSAPHTLRSISLKNTLGQTVLVQKVNSNSTQFNIGNLSKGTYILSIESVGNKTLNQKFIKK